MLSKELTMARAVRCVRGGTSVLLWLWRQINYAHVSSWQMSAVRARLPPYLLCFFPLSPSLLGGRGFFFVWEVYFMKFENNNCFDRKTNQSKREAIKKRSNIQTKGKISKHSRRRIQFWRQLASVYGVSRSMDSRSFEKLSNDFRYACFSTFHWLRSCNWVPFFMA